MRTALLTILKSASMQYLRELKCTLYTPWSVPQDPWGEDCTWLSLGALHHGNERVQVTDYRSLLLNRSQITDIIINTPA